MAGVITLSNVKKTYGNVIALDVEKLVLRQGSVCVLLGENGSGKTTLIRLIAGTVSSDEGIVEIGDGNFFYLPQKPYAFHLPLWKSVTLNVGVGKNSRRVLAEHMLEPMGLIKQFASRESALSGGEAQRAAISRIFSKPRSLLLLDEPTTGLDAEGATRFEKLLKDYYMKYTPTIIAATHDLGFARRLADFAVLMSSGRVYAQGTVDEIITVMERQRQC